jgi:nitrate reductase gamma subunit
VEQWLEWARGPFFRLSMALMLLGLLRLAVLNAVNIAQVLAQARDRGVPWRMVLRDTAAWLLPVAKVRSQGAFAGASFVFHIAAIITPIFLAAHIALWQRGLGVSWPALPQVAADYMTLTAIVALAVLFVRRVSAKATRALSGAQDYIIPLVMLVPFASGYLAMHPGINPFEYEATMLVHVISGNVVLIALPFSKLSHAVLFPTTQLVSELAWYLAPGSGQKIAAALGKESEPI